MSLDSEEWNQPDVSSKASLTGSDMVQIDEFLVNLIAIKVLAQ